MGTRTYNSKAEFERLNPYVIVNFSEYEPASIIANCSCKKSAENELLKIGGGEVMTRKKAEGKIKDWNDKRNF